MQVLSGGRTSVSSTNIRFLGGWRLIGDHSVLTASTLSSKIQPLETPYDATAEVYKVVYNNGKSKEVLGITYRSIEETTADMLNDWETRGLL